MGQKMQKHVEHSGHFDVQNLEKLLFVDYAPLSNYGI